MFLEIFCRQNKTEINCLHHSKFTLSTEIWFWKPISSSFCFFLVNIVIMSIFLWSYLEISCTLFHMVVYCYLCFFVNLSFFVNLIKFHKKSICPLFMKFSTPRANFLFGLFSHFINTQMMTTFTYYQKSFMPKNGRKKWLVSNTSKNKIKVV